MLGKVHGRLTVGVKRQSNLTPLVPLAGASDRECSRTRHRWSPRAVGNNKGAERVGRPSARRDERAAVPASDDLWLQVAAAVIDRMMYNVKISKSSAGSSTARQPIQKASGWIGPRPPTRPEPRHHGMSGFVELPTPPNRRADGGHICSLLAAAEALRALLATLACVSRPHAS